MKLKKILAGSMILLATHGITSAQVQDDQLIDAVGEETVKLDYQDLQFQQFASCDAMETVIEDFLKKNFDRWDYYPPMPFFGRGGGMVDEMAVDSAEDSASPVTNEAKSSSSNEYSTTNIQKEGVDEPDILKTDGKHFYYYNSETDKIHIISSPLDLNTQTVDLNRVDILTEIIVPQSLHDIEMFLYDGELIIIAGRYSEKAYRGYLDRNQRTAVVRYDVSNLYDLELISYQEFDGYKSDVRLHIEDGTLYVLTNISFNRWYGMPTRADEDDIDIDVTKVLPRSILVENDNGSLRPSVTQVTCDSLFYLFPNDEQLEHLGQWPSFTTVNAIDLDDDYTKTHVIFGQQSQIHMSQDRLFLAQGFYMPTTFSCPVNARCIEPFFWGGEQHTLVHGFELGGIRKLSYEGSNLVQGSPLHNQYSMDEHKGDFRILTQTRHDESATHLYVLDEDLMLVGKLTDIEPGERFQGSRFIGNKLYLITFEQVDPLFVIDISNSSVPKIIGELKMPGFSNYLHPIGQEANGIQYLAGVGYDTDENQRGGTVNAGVKLDLYKVDYNRNETTDSLCGKLIENTEEYQDCLTQVDTSRLRVEQIDSVVLGDQGSHTPVTDNPRLFVIDNNNTITLPLLLKEKVDEKKRCSTVYNKDGIKEEEDCESYGEFRSYFFGLKSFDINPGSSTPITETFSSNYLDKVKESYKYELYGYYMNQIGMRVGFAGDVMYIMTHLFADFILGDEHEEFTFAAG